MNANLSKTTIKGKETITLTISPSDNLERAFFNELFRSEVSVTVIPNTDEMLIQRKNDKDESTAQIVEIDQRQRAVGE